MQMRKYFTPLLFALLLPGASHAWIADLSCDDSARIKQMLTQSMGAERQGMGLRDPDTVLEIWVTPKHGDWTIVQNYANGTSCIVAMGESWESKSPQPAQPIPSSSRSVAGAGCGDKSEICE
jgi:hypothetical protein